jgi:uncharacterized protein (UPF0335 family)
MQTMNATEAKEMVKGYLEKIQHIDTEIQRLKEARGEILSEAKANGIDKSKLNKAISQIRKEQEKSPADLSEEEMYIALVQELAVIKPVK